MTVKKARAKSFLIKGLIYDNLLLCGMSVEELAQALGVHKSVIYNWLNGKCLPSLPAALAMAQVFGVTVEQLALGDDGE